MKTGRNYRGEKRLYFKPELGRCLHWSPKLQRSYIAWRKLITTLRGSFYVVSNAYQCANPSCPQPDVRYQSTEAERLSPKCYQVGIDVNAEVGNLRFKRRLVVINWFSAASSIPEVLYSPSMKWTWDFLYFSALSSRVWTANRSALRAPWKSKKEKRGHARKFASTTYTFHSE